MVSLKGFIKWCLELIVIIEVSAIGYLLYPYLKKVSPLDYLFTFIFIVGCFWMNGMFDKNKE